MTLKMKFKLLPCMQHDDGSAAGAAEDDGDIQQHDSVRARVQHLFKDHRANPVAVRHRALHQALRQGGPGTPACGLPLRVGAYTLLSHIRVMPCS